MQATDSPVPMADIHDIKPLEIPVADWSLLFYILGATLFLAVICAAFLYWKKNRRRRQVPAQAPIPPGEAALRSLEEIGDVENMDAKTFYFRLSNILRTYIEAFYNINALEMTTEELLPKTDLLGLNKEALQDLKDLLRSADPVKFAGVPAAAGKMRQDVAFVRKLIILTTGDGL